MDQNRVLLGIAIPSTFIVLFLLSSFYSSTISFSPFESSMVNRIFIQQCMGLLLAVFGIIITLYIAPESKKWLQIGNLNALAEPIKWLGIKEGDNWYKTGGGFLITLSIVTGGFMYMGLHNQLDWTKWVQMVPFILVFSLTNSFIEEIITRYMVVGLLEGFMTTKHIMIAAGLIFGLVHYFGNPGGPFGVMMAGFLGWFLAKSVLETQGIALAWTVHFVLDVIIFSMILIMK